jgi:hypothetical protein
MLLRPRPGGAHLPNCEYGSVEDDVLLVNEDELVPICVIR